MDVPTAGAGPVACGALGRYDAGRVRRMASAFSIDSLRPVHEADGSMLMLDREPIEWQGSRERGLGWIQGDRWRGAAREWTDAARLGACGLVLDGTRAFVHSAISGVAPIYWLDDDGATYFASRIDPLVRTATGRLTVDWDAWAAILALRHPVGERTPFAEVRRLGPSSVLRRRCRGGHSASPGWPWADTEAVLPLEAGADRLAAALRDSVAPLSGQIVCPLSGGWDSRVLICLLAEHRGVVPVAVTVSDDAGSNYEEGLAAAVAAELGIAHECVSGRIGEYPADWEERSRRVEYQFVDHAWLAPLARWLAGVRTPVPDGFGLDVFMQAGRRFFTPETLDRRHPRDAALALFESVRRYGLAHRALTQPFHAPIVGRARDQYLAAAKPFLGHPSQAVLTFYATRSVRGVATYLLGDSAEVLAPGVHDRVATAMLSVRSAEKLGGRLYTALFERIAPRAGRLPSTVEVKRGRPHLPRRWCSAPAIESHRRLLADGPLAPYLAPELRSWIDARPRPELSGDLRLGLEGVAILHAWWQRYRDRLSDVDAEELLDG